MQNRKVYIKSYDAISIAGLGKNEIFENLLDKRCFLAEDEKLFIGDKKLISGRIVDKNITLSDIEADKTTIFTVGGIARNNAVNFETSAEAIMAAFKAIQSGKENDILLLAHYELNDEFILELAAKGIYSSTIAKPFDIERLYEIIEFYISK